MKRLFSAIALTTLSAAQPGLAETVTFNVSVTARYACVTTSAPTYYVCGYDGSFAPISFLLQWDVPNVDGGVFRGPTTEVQSQLTSTMASWGKNTSGNFFSSTPFSAEIGAMQSGNGNYINSGTNLLEGSDRYDDWAATSGYPDHGARLTWVYTGRSEYTPPPTTGDGASYAYQSTISLYLRDTLTSASEVKALDGPTVRDRVISSNEQFEFVQTGLDMREGVVGGVFIGRTKYDYVEYTGTATIVPTPAAMLDALLAEVVGVGPGKSLYNKVTLAQTYYAVPDTQATCAVLTDFVSQVRAQRGKKITATKADKLTADALAIMRGIGCN